MRGFAFEEIDPEDARWGAALVHGEHDIYHLPGYVSAEALRTGARAAAGYVAWDSGALLLPYLVRRVEYSPGFYDASSPYGYPGALILGEADSATRRSAVGALLDGMRALRYCSLFLRMHPILADANDGFPLVSLHRTGDAVVVDLTRSQEELWAGLSKDVRRVIRRSRDCGMEFEATPLPKGLEEFTDIYLETMNRVGATAKYYTFDLKYFRRLYEALGNHLYLTRISRDGVTLSAGMNSLLGGIAQALFGGTYTAALPARPNVLEQYATIEGLREAGARVLNLGGGVGGQRDSLFRFKRSFSRETRPFYSVREVLLPDKYDILVREHARSTGVSANQLATTGHFPAYRAPA